MDESGIKARKKKTKKKKELVGRRRSEWDASDDDDFDLIGIVMRQINDGRRKRKN